MTTPPASLERRAGQRFSFNLPISLRDHATAAEGLGVTQDVSSRGAFFFTDMPFNPGAEIDLTLRMPSEITLGEAMRVRCKGRILRVVNPLERAAEIKIGVAVCFTGYEYFPEMEEASADFRRISALHGNNVHGSTEEQRPAALPSPVPRGAVH